MKNTCLIILILLGYTGSGFSQVSINQRPQILLTGIVRDASTLEPLNNSQIIINGRFRASSDETGSFSLQINRKDTVLFSLLGYKNETLYVSDTLSGPEFVVGVYMNSDTLSIGEVVIIPRLRSLKSDILKVPPYSTPELENAKYNLEVAGYQGRVTTGSLGDPSSNYSLLREKFRTDAYEKGTIPSNRMVSVSPLLVVPAVYLLMKGLPENPPPMQPRLTKEELEKIHKQYLENSRKKKVYD
jgi:CarboxypepD_reg-like domain